MPGPEVGGGAVEIELDGKPCKLVPTLEACIEISKLSGGLLQADQRCRSLNFETLVQIVGIGIQINGQRLNPKQQQDLLPKAVFEAGLFYVMAKCVEFIAVVGNGGKPITDEEEDGEEEAESGDPLASPQPSSTE